MRKTMFTGTLDFDSNRREDEADLPRSNFQHSKCNAHSTFSITKCAPLNYASLSGRLEYVPNKNSMLLERPSEPCLECGTSARNCTYYPCTREAEVRLASMRIFATIMLNAWRRRREEVKRLLFKVEELKNGSQKAKNQIHVYNTLFRVEQKRNDELTCQLKCSLENVLQAKSSCENLTTSVISLKAERALLEQDLIDKNKELEALADILSQTKTDFFQSMLEQRNLRSALSKQHRSVQVLENQKNKLINELYQLTNESRETEDKYRTELIRKELDFDRTNEKLQLLEAELNDLKAKSRRIDECALNDAGLRLEIETLHRRVATLQQALDNTFGRRAAAYWRKMCLYQQKSFNFAQICLYCLLPAVPLPDALQRRKVKQNLMLATAVDNALAQN